MPTQVVPHVGIHESWLSPDYGRWPDQIMGRFPHARVGRAFIDRSGAHAPEDLRPPVDIALQPYLAAGTPKVYLSIKTPIAATRNGDWNARYQQLGAHLAAINTGGEPTVVDLLAWHEPENDFSSGVAYAHYANKVRQFVRAGGGVAIDVGYCAMGYQWSPNRPSTREPGPWQQVEMDFYSVDAYSGRSYLLDVILPEHSGFVRWYREIANYGSRSGSYRVTERGFETPSVTAPETRYFMRSETINREFKWLRDSDTGGLCEEYVYWNSSGSETAVGLRLDPLGEEVMINLVAEFYELNLAAAVV